MPSQPRKNQSGSYFITWSDSSRTPRQKVESLKTKKLAIARRRANALDQLERNGYHDPWQQSWFRNASIKGFVESGVIDIQQLSQRDSVIRIQTARALREYVQHKITFAVWDSESARGYKSKLNGFIKHAPDHLDEIEIKHIQSYLKGKAPGYQSGLLQILTAFMNWAIEKKYMGKVIKYPLPKPQKSIPTFIENERFFEGCIEFLEKIQKQDDKRSYNKLWIVCSWVVLRFTGMRPKELRNLKTEFVSLDYKRIMVGGDFRTKTGRQRFVDIHEEAVAFFELLLSDKFRELHPYDKGYLLGDGNEYCQEQVRKEFNKVFDTKLYHLKDTYGFWIITKDENRDYNLIYLRDQFGHTSIKTTEVYLRVAPRKVPALHNWSKFDLFFSKVISCLSSI